jgi:hypothetical protein
MTSQTNLRLAEQFLGKLGSGSSAEEIAALCAPDLDWNIPGDSGVLPWVGHKTGSTAVAEFVRDTQTMIQRESLEIPRWPLQIPPPMATQTPPGRTAEL